MIQATKEELEGQIDSLKTALAQQRDSYGIAVQMRDAAREASQKDLMAKREAQDEAKKLRHALAFARSVIKSGESWTEQCETIIGGALK